MKNSNHNQISTIGLIIKTATITTIVFVLLALTIGGVWRWSNGFPTPKASADEVFSEKTLAGINNPATVSDEQNNMEVYKTVSPGVVLISTGSEKGDLYGERNEQSGTGSGVVIDNKGHILTNEHVVRNSKNLTVNLGGDKIYKAKLIGADADTDLAIIKIEAPSEELTVIPIGDSDSLTVGQKVLAIGNPFGLDRTLTTGVISGLERPIRSRNNRLIEGAIQTDASINPGNSGGPLLDSNGRMIGINSQILSPSGASNGIGFAIPVSIVKRVVPQLIESGKVIRPQLGVAIRSLSELKQQGLQFPVEEGLLILQVAPNSSAEKAGLQATKQDFDGSIKLGDIITSVGGRSVTSVDELYKAIEGLKIGDSIKLEILRDGAKQSIGIKLEAQTETSDKQPNQNPPKQRRNQSRF